MSKLSLYTLLIIGLFTPLEAKAGGSTLQLIIEDNTLLKDGVLVGELKLSYDGPDTTKFYRHKFSVIRQNVSFELECPSGRTKTITGYMGTYRGRQLLELDRGGSVVKPICLMRKDGERFFDEVGEYRIRATYKSGEKIVSDWVAIVVEEGKSGHAAFVKSHQYLGDVINPFRNRPWATENIAGIEDLGDYSAEQAKLVIYMLGGGEILRAILVTRDRSENAVDGARAGLELAKQYGYGIGLWEFMLDRIENPEKTDLHKNGYNVVVRDGYYF